LINNGGLAGRNSANLDQLRRVTANRPKKVNIRKLSNKPKLINNRFDNSAEAEQLGYA
jgi:hypothetical protein